MAIKGICLILTVNLLWFDCCSSLVSDLSTVVTAEGDELLLEGYSAHYDFASALDKLIQAKIRAAVLETINNSKTRPGLLLSDMDYKQYAFLNLLHSLSSKDIGYSNLLIQLFVNSDTDSPTDINTDLFSMINFPEKFLYQVVKSVAENSKIGLNEVPKFVSKYILKLVNTTKAFNNACFEGDSEIVKWFISLDIRPSVEALSLAWDNSHWDIVRIILQNISLSKQNVTEKLTKMTNGKNETLLHFAAESNRSDIVKLLIDAGTVVDSVSSKGITPFHNAFEGNCLQCIEMLLLKGENVYSKISLLQIAIKTNNAPAFKKMLDYIPPEEWKTNEDISLIYILTRKTIVSLVRSLLDGKLNRFKELRSLGIGQSVLYEALLSQSDYNQSFSQVFKTQLRMMQYMTRRPMKDMEEILKEGTSYSYLKGIAQFGNENHVTMLMSIAKNKSEEEEAFLFAVLYKNYEIVDALISQGVRLDGGDKQGNTALHFATQLGDIRMVERLLNGGANITAENIAGNNPPFLAILLGLDNILDLFLKEFNVNHPSSDNRTALYVAIQTNRTHIVRTLLSRGASLDNIFYELTPLIRAVNKDNLEMVTLLLDYGADINVASQDGTSALHIAAERGNTDILKLLISKGGNLNSRSSGGFTPLHHAVEAGRLANVKVIVESSYSTVNSCSSKRIRGIHIAAENGNLDILDYLAQRGADINAKDDNNETPLYKAAKEGHENVVRRLIQLGAKVAPCTSWGWSALHVAAEKGHVSIVKLLTRSGADVNAVNVEGKTPLFEAVFYDHEEVVFALIMDSANINLPGKFDGIPITPLKLANLFNKKRISDILRSFGGREVIDGYNGPTYIDTRIVSGHFELVPSWDSESLKKWLKRSQYLSLSC